MSKQDIRAHTTSELSLLVFNDEGLYRLRRNRVVLLEVLNDLFIYTAEQLEELEQDLRSDENENT